MFKRTQIDPVNVISYSQLRHARAFIAGLDDLPEFLRSDSDIVHGVEILRSRMQGRIGREGDFVLQGRIIDKNSIIGQGGGHKDRLATIIVKNGDDVEVIELRDEAYDKFMDVKPKAAPTGSSTTAEGVAR